MNNQIDKKLLDWILSIDDLDEVYAQNYGSFSLERMNFHIFFSDEEFDKFDEAEKHMIENNGIAQTAEIAYNFFKPVQAYNHELVHYYQALCLPAFNMYQKTTKRLIEFEAATLLRYFEQGHSYTLTKNKKILEALENPQFEMPLNDQLNFNKLLKNYKFFKEQWTSKYKNISLFYIIEGMAHIMSIQLTPYSSNYLFETDDKIEYNIAYDTFISYINEEYKDIDIRIKHLIFLYICYFSCHTYSTPKDEISEKSSRLFYTLTSKINLYLEIFINTLERYAEFSKDELIKLNQYQISDEDIQITNKNQLCNIYALFEIIPIMELDAKEFYPLDVFNTLETPSKYFEILKKDLNIDLLSIYQLANFNIFPVKIADMWEAYNKIQELKIDDDNKFDNTDESSFYELILSCKKLLDKKYIPIPCCKEHQSISNKLEVLHCKNEGGFAYYMKELTNREAIELFKVLEVN